jgi:hypothetical protein
METRQLKLTGFLYIICLLISSCASLKNSGFKQTVPIQLNIQTNEPQLRGVNLNYYGLKLLDRLDDFSAVSLHQVDEADSAAIILNLNINRFNSFPPDQRSSQKVYRRNVQVATDANGKPVYQTVSAVATVVQNIFRTSASFDANVLIKGSPGKTFKKNFTENFNFQSVYVANVQGDQRALDASVISATMRPMDPTVDDILLALSNREMLDRLSREIRTYYDTKPVK